jgi:mannitol/fructose-specific phosphotransferase system IIA component (Ntr-type)
VVRPFILLGRSEEGLATESPDDKPVDLVFVMGLRYQELHLPWLAQLSSLLSRKDARVQLLAATSRRELFERLCVLAGE